ncbi:MAG: hypothetical protein IJP78_00910 [Clostridia bacterium]|nr:hypothetical protein [Clostridia bacterium]
MTREDLLAAIGEIDETMAMEADTERKAYRMKGKRLLAVVAAVLLLTCTAGALAAVNEDINALLYRVWPWASQALKPVNLVCEDQGIRMEVVSASLRGQEAFVTLTMRDMTGDRIDGTVDLFDSETLWLPYDGSGTCTLLDYDPETGTASFAVYMRFSEQPAETDKVTFSVSRVLTGKRKITVDLTPLLGEIREAETVPVPGGIRGGSVDGDGVEVLNPENSREITVTEGVTLAGAGLCGGALHVQLRYDDIYHTDNHGFLALTDTAGNDYGHGELPKGIGTVSWFGRETNGVDSSDSWQEYIFTDYPEKLENLVLTGEFITADPYIAGDWKVSFPLKSISE